MNDLIIQKNDITQSQFITKLRQNSKKYFPLILEESGHKCQICGWGDTAFNCLQIHHILPVTQFSKQFIGKEFFLLPSKEYETANLVALCPNCHAFTHRFRRGVNEAHKGRIIKSFENLYKEDEVIKRFIDIATGNHFFQNPMSNRDPFDSMILFKNSYSVTIKGESTP